MLSGNRTLPTGALGVGAGRHHHRGLQRQAWAAAAIMRLESRCQALPHSVPGVCGPQPPLCDDKQSPSPAPAIPGAHKCHSTCTHHIKGIMASTCCGKRQQASKLKAAPQFWTRWQKDLSSPSLTKTPKSQLTAEQPKKTGTY